MLGRDTVLVLEKRLFQLLIFLMPTQLAKHFWPTSSKVLGIRIDYLSPTIYLTDIVVGILFLLFVYENLFLEKRKYKLSKSAPIIAAFALFVVVGNLYYSVSFTTSFYKWVKVFEFFFVGFFVYETKLLELYSWITKPLVYSLIPVGIIFVGQLLLQKSVGGAFYFFGERHFSASTPGISLVSVFGRSYLRPYSTFPHPNALGGYLLVSLILILVSRKMFSRASEYLIYFILALGMILTFSLNIYLTVLILALIWFLDVRKILKVKYTAKLVFIFSILSSLVSPIVSSKFLGTNFAQTIQRRIELSFVSGQMVVQNPLFGVGLGNFVTSLPHYLFQDKMVWWLQPVHNIFLLTLSETGILGLIPLSYVIFEAISHLSSFDKEENKLLLLGICAILVTGFSDHYWLTLQQNQLLFSLVLGLSFRKKFH